MSLLRAISKKERLVWIAVTLSLAGFILLVSLAPDLIAQGTASEDQKALQKFNEVYYYIKDNYVDVDKTDPKRLIDGALDGLLKSLDDPYSVYLKNQARTEMEDVTAGSFGGIGCYIDKQRVFDKDGKPVENTPIEIVSPFEGTPAYRAGINAGDLILKIEDESTLSMSTDDAVKRLRGTAGTQVKLTIRRGASLEFDVTITRGTIEIPTVKSALINGKVGYVKILEFSKFTPARVKTAVTDLLAKGAASFVIDLRSNPGGLLDSAVGIADYFLSEGTIVSVLGRSPADNTVYFAKKNNDLVPAAMPVTVLINKSSASASEILAGALQDSGRAAIVGETSYGKGSVQVAMFMGDTAFKITVSKYYTPSGASVEKKGVIPNVEAKEPDLTEAELASYARVIKENLIADFVKQNPKPSGKQILDFIASLQKRGIDLRESVLRRLILVEVNRTVNDQPIYDLESDLALRKALEVLDAAKTKKK